MTSTDTITTTTMTTHKFSDYANRGITGLTNLGNTCFINSCIQCLSHTYEFNDFLSKGSGNYRKILNNKPESVLLVEWDDLRKLMWSQNCIISPGRFINSVQRISKATNHELFSGWSQNDLPEFLLFVLESFHNALTREVIMDIKGNIRTKKDEMGKRCYEMMKEKYTKDYSEILNIFFGIHVSVLTPIASSTSSSSTTRELDTKYLSITPEPFMIIHLPIPTKEELNIQKTDKNITLFDCFDKHCEKEALDGDNMWFNETTNQKEAVNKRILFWSLPNVMILDIKRFITSYATGRTKKNQVFIDIPIHDVDFSKYVEGYGKEGYIYDLYAICNHHGQVEGGHYSATIKNANGRWYNFNDTMVKEITINADIISGNTPYCLFYRKKSMNK